MFPRGRTLPERSREIVAAHGSRVAWIEGDRRITFADAASMIERLAGHLARLGAQTGTVVSWQLPNRWEAAIVHHAAVATGALSNPLQPAWGPRELRSALAQARPAVLVVQARWRGTDRVSVAREACAAAGIDVPLVTVDGEGPLDLSALLQAPARAPAPPADPAGSAVLLFTSGTTSEPKGVLHTHRGLLCEVDSFPAIHGLGPEDRALCGAPLAHIAGLTYGLLAPFALGTSSVLLRRWSPGRALEAIARDRVTFMTGPPTFLLSLAEHQDVGALDLSSFRLFSTGGAMIHAPALRDAMARLGCVVKRAYGSTEVPTLTACMVEDEEEIRLTTDGRPIGGGEVRIVEPGGADVPAGEEGEIWGRAPEMFVGYLDASLNDGAFAAGGWFRTGDLGRLDERGLLHVTGRLKDIIIRGGENISALELEELLLEHPAVAEAAVIGLPDERLGERVCACVVVRSSFSFDAMIAHLRTYGIATHKLPERLEAVGALPKTDSGKVRKADLVERFSAG